MSADDHLRIGPLSLHLPSLRNNTRTHTHCDVDRDDKINVGSNGVEDEEGLEVHDIIGTILGVGAVLVSAVVLVWKLRNSENKSNECKVFFGCEDKAASVCRYTHQGESGGRCTLKTTSEFCTHHSCDNHPKCPNPKTQKADLCDDCKNDATYGAGSFKRVGSSVLSKKVSEFSITIPTIPDDDAIYAEPTSPRAMCEVAPAGSHPQGTKRRSTESVTSAQSTRSVNTESTI